MQKIKQIPFYSVAIFTIVSISCIGSEHIGERLGKSVATGLENGSQNISKALEGASQNVSQGLEGAAQKVFTGLEGASQKVSNAIAEGAPSVGINAAMTLGEAGKDMSKNLSEGFVTGLENGATKIGSETAQKLAPYMGAFVGIFAIKEVATIGIDIYKYNNPDQKTIERNNAAKKKNAIYDAEDVFRNCLMKNAYNPKKNKSGLSVACEECGKTFSMTAGRAAYLDMSETYKSTYQDL